MSSPTRPDDDATEISRQVAPPAGRSADGFNLKADSPGEKIVDAIEMIGEETAAGLRPKGSPDISPGMRYLHSSRTIHQLVTDRNRAVAIYLGVASLLVTASSALLNAEPQGDLIVPLAEVKRWCLPVTFGTLTVLAALVALLLVRTRVGLIYEVAKMNALLGLPVGRVKRINPLSIHFILQSIISLAGGLCGGLFSVWMLRLSDPSAEVAVPAALIGVAVTGLLLLLYVLSVVRITSDERLERAAK